MKIAVSATGNDLDSPFSPVFGRCPIYVIVDTDTMAFQAVPNEAMMAAGGAGIQAAQDVANRGAKAIVTGNVGPNAYRVLASAGLQVYLFGGGTVRQAVEAFKSGQLSSIGGPSAPAHAGMGMMRGMGMGRGMGGQGMGGRGMGMGRGMGGSQGGYGLGGPTSPQTPPQPAGPTGGSSPSGGELSSLKAEVSELRDRLGKLVDRIEGLKGE